jgi:hypothetical protein
MCIILQLPVWPCEALDVYTWCLAPRLDNECTYSYIIVGHVSLLTPPPHSTPLHPYPTPQSPPNPHPQV